MQTENNISKTDFINLKNEYDEKGFFVINKAIDFELLSDAFFEIINSKEAILYNDRHNKLRRIEQIYDKGPNLIKVHHTILNFLSKIFSEEFYIFKDKYNAKPPDGEGFFAHYDGIFEWPDNKETIRNGWYYYAKTFVNVLVCIDPMTSKNGPLEIANADIGSFEKLLQNTNKDGTPDIKDAIEKRTKFETIICDPGDLVFFSNRCPHRSSKNNSKQNRRTIYYTYNPKKEGDNYFKYFSDKALSKNPARKSLSGEL